MMLISVVAACVGYWDLGKYLYGQSLMVRPGGTGTDRVIYLKDTMGKTNRDGDEIAWL